MCGILGFITKNSYKNIFNENDGIRSLKYLEKRGPDSFNSKYRNGKI